MDKFRSNNINYEDKIKEIIDYQKGVGDLPKSNVIKIIFENGSSIVARPSGTEPKLKIYFSFKGKSIEENEKSYNKFLQLIEKEIQ